MQSLLCILLSFCFVLSEGWIFDLQLVVCHTLEQKLVLVLPAISFGFLTCRWEPGA